MARNQAMLAEAVYQTALQSIPDAVTALEAAIAELAGEGEGDDDIDGDSLDEELFGGCY